MFTRSIRRKLFYRLTAMTVVAAILLLLHVIINNKYVIDWLSSIGQFDVFALYNLYNNANLYNLNSFNSIWFGSIRFDLVQFDHLLCAAVTHCVCVWLCVRCLHWEYSTLVILVCQLLCVHDKSFVWTSLLLFELFIAVIMVLFSHYYHYYYFSLNLVDSTQRICNIIVTMPSIYKMVYKVYMHEKPLIKPFIAYIVMGTRIDKWKKNSDLEHNI